MEAAREMIKKEQSVDLLLMMDCTSSMSHWIKESQKNLIKIIDSVTQKASFKCKIRCGYIGYRDFGDTGLTSEHYDIMPMTDDI
jgi:hypothetical protein